MLTIAGNVTVCNFVFMAQKSFYTKKLGELVASDAKGLKELRYLVMSSLYGGWSVVRHGAKRAVRVFDSQKDAVAFAKKYAISKSAVALTIHDKNGMVKKYIRFKNIPH